MLSSMAINYTQTAPSFELRIRDYGERDVRIWLGDGQELCTQFASPVTPSHRARLEHYFDVPPLRRSANGEDLAEIERSLHDLGRALGERLCDSEYRLLELLARVEKAGIGQLRVVIESARASFLAEPWELLLLPDSPYVAASACGGFVRSRPGAEWDAEVRLACSSQRPLSALRVVNARRPALRWQQRLACRGEALRPELMSAADASELAERLARGSLDVVHFDGIDELLADHAALLPQLTAAGVELLILDPGPTAAPRERIHELAIALLAGGIGNIVLLDAALTASDSEPSLLALYDQLCAGLDVERAVIEARKLLQQQFMAQAKRRTLQTWSALCHYARRQLSCFEQAQPELPQERGPALGRARARMLGFRAHHLPQPSAAVLPAAGEDALAWRQALERGGATVMCGARGIGTTRALHESVLSLVLEGRSARALYWDFNADAYTAEDVRQMIAGALQLTAAEGEAVASALVRERCLCVFENLTGDEPDFGALAELFAQLAAHGATLAIATHRVACFERLRPLGRELRRLPLTAAEARAYLDAFWAGSDRAYDEAMAAELIEAAAGQPFLLRKLGELRAHDEAASLVGLKDLWGSPEDPVSAFFTWRWSLLPAQWRPLLACLSGLGECFLEMWSPAFDARPPNGEGRGTKAGMLLWRALGAPADATYASALELFEGAGWVLRRDAGRVIDPAAQPLLREHAPALDELTLDAFVCEGVARLAAHQLRTPHPSILDNLIAQRGTWRRHLEGLWSAGRYAAVLHTFVALTRVLQNAKLAAELPQLALGLLERTAPEHVADLDEAGALAWLHVAQRALPQPTAAEAPSLRAGAQRWWCRLADAAWRSSAPAALFDQAVGFLRRFYDAAADYAAYRALCLVAIEHYAALGEPAKRRASSHALAACEFELGHRDEAERIEAELLEDVALSDDERFDAALAVATARLRRGDADGCGTLLERATSHASADNPPYQLLSAELDLARARAEDALERLCGVWNGVMTRRQTSDVDRLVALLHQAARALGAARFEELYARWAPESPAPRELGLLPPEPTSAEAH
jgi:hypothetical protein